MRRTVIVAFVAIAVALAGCTGYGGGSGPTYGGDTGGNTGTTNGDTGTAGDTGTDGGTSGDTADGGSDTPAVEKVSGVSPDRTIKLTNYAFSATSPQISAGTVVKFVNQEGSHTVTLDSAGIDVTLSGSQSVMLRFNEAGSYQVYCKFHGSPGSGMHSNVQVS